MTSNWVSSSFSRKRSQKGRRDGEGNVIQESGSIEPKTHNLWTDMFEPTKEEELAVNSKKIQQAKNWLKSALAGELGKSPMAVFSGPSGSGKTTTIKVLSKYMEVNLREWTCPSTTTTATYTDTQGEGRFDYDSSAQVKQFEEFLFRASRYSTVFDEKDAAKSILIVEDIPNVYLHNPSFLQKSLHKYADYGLSPIIFIMYSSGSQDFNMERLLFKPQLIKDLNINIISFNPTCRSLIFKALWRVAHLAHLPLNLTMKESIELVAAISNGDVRFAVNQLQFMVCGAKGPDPPNVHKSKVRRRMEPKKKSKKGEKPSNELMLRDPSTDVFRCIGRVLYCKKEKVVDVKTKTAKEQLSHDPFQIVRSMSASPNLYLGLLSENYPTVFNDIKKIAEASESICRAENLMTCHMNSEIGVEYGLCVSVLGLMNSSSDNITRRFNPFRGSKAKEAFYACNEKLQTCKSLFPESRHSPRTLLRDVLPFMSKIGTSRLPEDKRNFIRAVADFTSLSFVSTRVSDDGPGPSSACESTTELPRVDPVVKVESRVILKTADDDDDDDVVIIEQNIVPEETADNEDDEVMIIDVRVPIKLECTTVDEDDDVVVIDDDDDEVVIIEDESS